MVTRITPCIPASEGLEGRMEGEGGMEGEGRDGRRGKVREGMEGDGREGR